MRSLIQPYALAVCFCSLMCLVIALGFGLYDVVRLAAPAFTMAGGWTDSNEQFTLYRPDKANLPEPEITRMREDAHAQALREERRTAGQQLVFALIIVLIDAIVFGVHWAIAKRSERRLALAT